MNFENQAKPDPISNKSTLDDHFNQEVETVCRLLLDAETTEKYIAVVEGQGDEFLDDKNIKLIGAALQSLSELPKEIKDSKEAIETLAEKCLFSARRIIPEVFFPILKMYSPERADQIEPLHKVFQQLRAIYENAPVSRGGPMIDYKQIKEPAKHLVQLAEDPNNTLIIAQYLTSQSTVMKDVAFKAVVASPHKEIINSVMIAAIEEWRDGFVFGYGSCHHAIAALDIRHTDARREIEKLLDPIYFEFIVPTSTAIARNGDKELVSNLYDQLLNFEFLKSSKAHYLGTVARNIAPLLTEEQSEELAKFLYLPSRKAASWIANKEPGGLNRIRTFFSLYPLSSHDDPVSNARIIAALAIEKKKPELSTGVLLQETNGGETFTGRGHFFLRGEAIQSLKRLGKMTNEPDFQRVFREITGIDAEPKDIIRHFMTRRDESKDQ